MRIPPYWAKETHRDDGPPGKFSSITACGWSCVSLDDAQAEQLFRAWATEYDQRDSRYQICRLIHVYGDIATDSIETIVKLHDRDTRVNADAELA